MKNVRSIVLAVGIATAVTGPCMVIPSVAFAQQRDLEKAKEAYQVGKAAYDAGDFLAAATKFVESYEYSGRDELLFNIGQAYRQAGKLIESERYFQQYLQAKPDAPNADDVVNFVIEIQQQIAAEYGTVEFASQVPAKVVVGDARCDTPCVLTLKAGKVTYTATSKSGSKTGEVVLEPSKTATVALAFEPGEKTGFVKLESDRPATVSVDGRDIATLPLARPLELPEGDHQLLVKDGKAQWAGTVNVGADETLRMVVPLSGGGETSWKRVAAYTLGGTGVAFAVGAIVMGMQASDTFDTLDAQQNQRGYADSDLVSQGESQALTANVLYVASALAIGAGVGLFVWDLYGQDGEVAAPSQEPARKPAEKPVESGAQPEEDDLLL